MPRIDPRIIFHQRFVVYKQCQIIKANGEQCGRVPAPGSDRCTLHGNCAGVDPNVIETHAEYKLKVQEVNAQLASVDIPHINALAHALKDGVDSIVETFKVLSRAYKVAMVKYVYSLSKNLDAPKEELEIAKANWDEFVSIFKPALELFHIQGTLPHPILSDSFQELCRFEIIQPVQKKYVSMTNIPLQIADVPVFDLPARASTAKRTAVVEPETAPCPKRNAPVIYVDADEELDAEDAAQLAAEGGADDILSDEERSVDEELTADDLAFIDNSPQPTGISGFASELMDKAARFVRRK